MLADGAVYRCPSAGDARDVMQIRKQLRLGPSVETMDLKEAEGAHAVLFDETRPCTLYSVYLLPTVAPTVVCV